MIQHLPGCLRVSGTQRSKIKAHRVCGRGIFIIPLFFLFAIGFNSSTAQTCPSTGTTTLTTPPNSYFPGGLAGVAADFPIGTTAITYRAAPTGYQSAGSTLAVGDVILIIQMQGTTISSTNSTAYGDGTTAGIGYTAGTGVFVAGLMEYNSVAAITGTTITLNSGTVNAYRNADFGTTGQYRFQILKVNPLYLCTLGGTITGPAWNGLVGGVVVLSVTKTLTWAGQTITMNGKGFRGGGGRKLTGVGSGATTTDYVNLSSLAVHGSKGEGLSGSPRYMNDPSFSTTAVWDDLVEGYPSGSNARGAPGNAGGGATDGSTSDNSQNSGGGGGGNAGVGGRGGNTWSSNAAVGGLGGKNFAEVVPNRLVMGGGGGAGSTNDGTGGGGLGFYSSGVAGGGIVIVNANVMAGTGTVTVNGTSGFTTVVNDGNGGGGAGGSVLLYSTTTAGLANITVTANGGAGGSNTQTPYTGAHGPGGGGGGGVIYSNGAIASGTVTGGASGTSTYYPFVLAAATTNAYNAVAGSNGFQLANVNTANIPPNMRQCQVIALPVSLIDFSGTLKENNSVALAWSTSAEVDFSHFVIERSTDATTFTSLGEVAAATGDAQTKVYGYADPIGGITGDFFYYRLKMVDQDNSFAYSKTVLIRRNGNDAAFALYPNPVTDHLQFDISLAVAGRLEYKVMDNSGRVLQQHTTTAGKGKASVVVSGLNKFAPGNYILQVRSANQVYTRKVIKR